MKVILSYLAHRKMKYYIEEIDYEISGLGTVEKLSNGDLFVPDIYLFEQTVTGTETQLKASDIDKFYDTLLAQAINVSPEEREKVYDNIGKIKLWWHSHVNMDTFWSGTDVATQNSLDVDLDVDNWWLSIVGNKAGKRKAKLDVYKPHRLWLDDIDIVIDENDDLRESIKKEIEEKVTQPVKYAAPVSNFYNAGGWGKNGSRKKSFSRANIKQPVTNDMREMVDDIDDNYVQEGGIYIPHKEKQLKKISNRKL